MWQKPKVELRLFLKKREFKEKIFIEFFQKNDTQNSTAFLRFQKLLVLMFDKYF